MTTSDDGNDADSVFGLWCAKRDQINAIDYGRRTEAYDGQRDDLRRDADDLATRYRGLTGRAPT
ncbi:hypothetical protein [Cupriavidus malaysiensis]|uniref:hypothetical protein n=1 Tax=Cupriavidus malaysiensis TaxID=367825 RepID=UPI0012FF622C|nr:hypothetical protein [Cupriavidus malaysiensis]